jgi:hypothetical protein
MARPGPKREPLEVRYWRHVEIRGDRDCWPWTGATNGKGYGVVARGGDSNGVSPLYAHRVAYALERGIDPRSPLMPAVVRHFKCNNPACQNPTHLRGGSHWDNHHDMISQGRGWWQNPATVARSMATRAARRAKENA